MKCYLHLAFSTCRLDRMSKSSRSKNVDVISDGKMTTQVKTTAKPVDIVMVQHFQSKRFFRSKNWVVTKIRNGSEKIRMLSSSGSSSDWRLVSPCVTSVTFCYRNCDNAVTFIITEVVTSALLGSCGRVSDKKFAHLDQKTDFRSKTYVYFLFHKTRWENFRERGREGIISRGSVQPLPLFFPLNQ